MTVMECWSLHGIDSKLSNKCAAKFKICLLRCHVGNTMSTRRRLHSWPRALALMSSRNLASNPVMSSVEESATAPLSARSASGLLVADPNNVCPRWCVQALPIDSRLVTKNVCRTMHAVEATFCSWWHEVLQWGRCCTAWGECGKPLSVCTTKGIPFLCVWQGVHGLRPFGYDPRKWNVENECLWPTAWSLHDLLDLWHQRLRRNRPGFSTPETCNENITTGLCSWQLRWSVPVIPGTKWSGRYRKMRYGGVNIDASKCSPSSVNPQDVWFTEACTNPALILPRAADTNLEMHMIMMNNFGCRGI